MTTKKITTKKKYSNWYVKLNIADKLVPLTGWVMHGSTEEHLAEMLTALLPLGEKPLTRDTIANWKRCHPEFAEIFKHGKPFSDGCLLNAANKKACGYDYTEEVYSVKQDKVIVLHKHVEPDTGMLCFMLKNKFAPNNTKLPADVERFSEKHEITGENGEPLFKGLLNELRGLENAPEKS